MAQSKSQHTTIMIKLSDNGKTKFRKNHNNTFGLMYGKPENGGTCPGATCGSGGCLDVKVGRTTQTCYMAKITRIYKNVGKVLLENTLALEGKTKEEMTVMLRGLVQVFIYNSKGEDLYFRLHYSGDFFSQAYAEAWADVIKEFPQVQFWGYSRSVFKDGTDYVQPLLGIKNLTFFLSCDPDNFGLMQEFFEKHKENNPQLGMAWMGDTAPDAEKHRWVKCPEITKKVPNTDKAGACSKCRLCVDNYKVRVKNIQFLTH